MNFGNCAETHITLKKTANKHMNPPPISNLPPATDNQDKSWGGKKLTLGWWLGMIAMAVFSSLCCWLATRISRANADYATGQIVGGIIWPLIIAALLAIAKYFRKAPRRLALVAMIAYGFFGVANLATSLQRTNDDVVMDTVDKEMQELKRQAAQTSDPKARADIEQRIETLLRNAPDKFSTKREADELRALQKFVEPILVQSRARAAAQQDFIDGDIDWARKYANTKETLALGRERLARLMQQDALLSQTTDSIVAKAAAIIKNNDTSLGISMDGLRGFCSSYAKKDQFLKNIHKANARLCARIDDALAMLQTEWGRWSKRSDGVIIWDNNELLEKFNAIYHDIVTVSAQLDEAQKAMLNQK